MDFPTMATAILNLQPKSEFTMLDDDYDSIQWLNQNVPMPTRKEIEDEFTRLRDLYASLEYQRSRQKEYPRIEDQLDDIYHNGIEGWRNTIQSVKNKYPKNSI